MNSHEIEQLLRVRFCPPEWAFMPQVRNGTGSHFSRTADALAMELYPSRGLTLNGFEIKVYRNDWIKELKNPDKAEAVAKYCDYWWVVAPKEIVKVEEIPAKWGLMIPISNGIKVVKEAEKLKAKPLDRAFVASILRLAQNTIAPEVKINEALEMGKIKGQEIAERRFETERDEHKRLKSALEEFEVKSGIIINRWCYGNIGEAVRIVLDKKDEQIKNRLDGLLENAESIVSDIKKALNAK